MQVSARITLATSFLVAAILAINAIVDLRSAANERTEQFKDNLRLMGVAARTLVEEQPVELLVEHRPDVLRKLQVLDKTAIFTIYLESQGHRWESESSRFQLFQSAQMPQLYTEFDNAMLFSLPIRAVNPAKPEGYSLIGLVEVKKPLAELAGASQDHFFRMIPVYVAIVLGVVLAVMLATRSLIARPIKQLLTGIDEVAKGDLSRALLSERDDEIGALANRFNEMTQSLRESRAETERENRARIRVEERLFQSEKLATIGQIAAEIAHEVGTPLNVIGGRARGLAKKAADPDSVAKNAAIIAEQTSRITRIIQRLLDMARRRVGETEKAPLSINQLIESTLDFLEVRFSSSNVTVEKKLGEIPPVGGNSDQLQQVLLNLFTNSVEAMPQGGVLKVRSYLGSHKRPGLESTPEVSVVVVEVVDNGVGIPSDERSQIFEPFHTSKMSRGGTGLGLSVSLSLVRDHDGWMEARDGDNGAGTCMAVYLPIG